MVSKSTKRGRRKLVLLAAALTLVGVGSVTNPAPAEAAEYPVGCWTTARGGSQANHRLWCWTGTNNNIYDNASDMAVMAQRILAGNGFYSGLIDGQYGNISANATRSFQASRGLVVDGLIGGETWVSLMYTAITDCGILNHPGYQTFGYQISGENCGVHLQQYADYIYTVRAYNNNGSSPHDPAVNDFVLATLNGPTSLPTVTGTAAPATDLGGSDMDALVATATELGLTVDRATEVVDSQDQPVVEDHTFSASDGISYYRTLTWADQASVDEYFEHLTAYPGEYAYIPVETSAGRSYVRDLGDGTWQGFAYDASLERLTNVQVDATDFPGGAVDEAIGEIAEELLS